MSTTLPSGIFNTHKTDYQEVKPFFNQQAGLFDTVNKNFPEQWKLYKTLKKLDWDENEFDYSSCNVQFKTCDRTVYDRMIKTLAWQWETDSVAGRIIPLVLACIEPSSDMAALYGRIGDNENVHSATYSEIVRNSFDNPEEILAEILTVKESIARLSTVSAVFERARDTALNYALYPESGYTQEMYNDIFMFFVALFITERVQFMASFGITFGICQTTGLFQPIGAAVQKIAQDEYEIHVQAGINTLSACLQTDQGRAAYQQCRQQIADLLNEVVRTEVIWNDFTFQDGSDEMVGVTHQMVDDWVFYNALDAARFLNITDLILFNRVEDNPMLFMDKWMNISSIQRSPQEENKGDYMVGVIQNDDEGKVFELDEF